MPQHTNAPTDPPDRRPRTASRRAIIAALALSAAAFAIATATASADPPWSAPSVVPGTGNGPAATTSFGHVVALTTAPGNGGPNETTDMVRLNPADGSVLSTTGLALGDASVAAYARDAVAVAGSSIGPSGTIDDQSQAEVGTTSAAGGTPTLRTLPGTRGQTVTAIAGDARGDIVVATRGLRSRLIFLRHAGTFTFSRVLTIPVGAQGRDVTVTVSPDGQLLVAWEDHHEVFARHRGTHGTWGAVHTLGAGIQSRLQVAMDGTGRMMVAWESQRVDEGEAAGPAVVDFITAAPGHGFDPVRQVDIVGASGTGRAVSSPGVRLQLTRANTALLAWTGFDGAHFVVRDVPLAAGHIGPRQQLSPLRVDAVLGDIATTPDGDALVLWRSNVLGTDAVPGSRPQLFGNVRAANAATFGGPEAIGGDSRPVFSSPTAALDPTTGRAVAVFTDFATSQVLASVRTPVAP